MSAKKYRKKPVEIEAIKFDGNNSDDCLSFIDAGDYIIKGVHDEFYPCKPDIFKETYEVVYEQI